MALTAPSAFTSRLKVKICSRGWPWGASHLNWQIIRYADVLLWKAEALSRDWTKLPDWKKTRKIINRIRLRAKNSPYVKDFKHPELKCGQLPDRRISG